MLDRTKLIRELRTLQQDLFFDLSGQKIIAQQVWDTIAQDQAFGPKLRACQPPWLVPYWSGLLDQQYTVNPPQAGYQVACVDGSQIYPDRHQGTSCFLINIGTVLLSYHAVGKTILNSVPQVFVNAHQTGDQSTDMVNSKRHEYELAALTQMIPQVTDSNRALFVLDGSLIFWQLESFEPSIKQMYLTAYLQSLEKFYMANCMVASYISMPRSKELLNLIRVALCNFNFDCLAPADVVEQLVDTHIMHGYLQPYNRTQVFQNNSSIVEQYPLALRPYFFYLHVGSEIGRVEIPGWIAQDANAVDRVASYLLDQAVKGRGYPVCLAEAHEQAVVKGPDRDFFYHLIQKIGLEQKQRIAVSQKSIKKRRMGV